MVPASAEGQGPLPTAHLPKVEPLQGDLLPGRGAHSPALPAPGEGTAACSLTHGHRHGRDSVAFLIDRSQAGPRWERVAGELGRGAWPADSARAAGAQGAGRLSWALLWPPWAPGRGASTAPHTVQLWGWPLTWAGYA